jgi:hypothetical protein
MSTGLAAWNMESTDGIAGYYARASAMAELVPWERWSSVGRFHSPGYPEYLRHYVAIVSDAQVLLDGRPVAMTPAPVGGYREALVEVGPGDHLLAAEGCGRFGAIAYGHAQGYEEYVPPHARKGDDETIASAPHPSRYWEKLGIAYAYPVLGEEGDTGPMVRASLGRDHVAVPGDLLDIPVMLDGGDLTGVTSLAFVVTFDTMLMAPGSGMLDHLTDGTLLAGWTVSDFREEAGRVIFTLTAPPGAPPLTGPGRLVRLGFASFIRLLPPYTLLPDEYASVSAVISMAPDCRRMAVSPGEVHFKICGTNSRQIERIAGGFSLDGSRPNPFNPVTEIGFTIALDGETTLTIYDGSGRRVATLVDAPLPAGNYLFRWDATGFPSGIYRYRVTSGEWSADGSVVLLK